MPRPLRAQTVVITGASSGIGRATAVACARRGAAVVLAARGEAALRTAADEVTAAGGRALMVPTDVAEWPQVERLAAQAVDRFGRIDTWVNAAAVAEYATFETTSVEECQRIIQVNLMGVAHGAKAALPYMRRQGDGTIVNIGSVLSIASVPYQAAYNAAKHGVRGLSDSLRMELLRDRTGIHVTLIMPASINTPFFSHARSKLGVHPKPIPIVYEPEAVAEAIAFAAEHPRREIVVGGAGKLLTVVHRLAPGLVERLLVLSGVGFRQQRTTRPDDGRDNLFAPSWGPGATRGEFPGWRSSTFTRLLELHPARKLALALSGAAALALLARRRPPRTVRADEVWSERAAREEALAQPEAFSRPVA